MHAARRRGRFGPGGLYPVDELIEQLGITINQYNQAVAHDANQRKPRLDTSHAGFLRAFQGHSADCGHPMGFMMEGLSETAINDLIYRYGPAMWHGTDLHVVPSMIQNGLIPGGGPGGRLGVHYVLGHCPTQWEDGRRGFRRGSTCIVEVRLAVLRDAGVPIYAGVCGADGVALTGQIRATGISRIWALPKGSPVYSVLIAELEVDRLVQHVDLKSLGDTSAGPHPPLGRGPKLGTVQASQAAAASSGAASSSTVVLAPAGRVMAAGAAQPVTPPKAAPKVKGGASGTPRTSIVPAKPKVYPRRNVPGPNVLEAEDSLEEEAAQEPEGVEEDSSSSDLPDTRAPQAAVKVKEDEEPASGAQAESTEEGVLVLGQSVVTSAKEYLARSEALLRAQKLQSKILEVAGTAMVKLEKITKREESLKTLRREGESRAAGEGADGEEVSDDGQDAPGVEGASSSARPSRGGTVQSAPAPEVPRPNADGHYGCSAPGCGLAFESLVQYHLHQAACHGASLPPNLGISPSAPLDPFRQDWRGRLLSRGKDGGYGEVPMLRVIRYHKANGYDHSRVPLLKRGDRIQLEDGSHHIYGGSHPPGWLRDDPELDPPPEGSDGGSTPKSEPTEEADPGPPREAAPRGRALGPPKSDVQRRLAERRSKRDYSPDLVTPLDDLHAKEIDSFFAGDPAADSLDVILMRAEVRTEREEPLAKEEQEEEAEVVKDEEVSVEMEAATADEADEVALPANRAYVEGRFYPYGSWRCFFCEAINPVTEDQCLTTHAGGPEAGAPCDGRWINGIDIGWWEVDPQTAPEQWRRRFSAEELEEQQARADAARLLSDEELAEALQAAEEAQAAERAKKRERRQAEKAERDDHISEALRIAGWQCPNCYEWNLSFRQLCFRCSTPLRLAEVVSRGIPDPRRGEERNSGSESSQDELEHEILLANRAMDEETIQPLLRNKHKKRGGKRRREDATYGKGRDPWSAWADARGKGQGKPKGRGKSDAKGKPKGRGKYAWGAYAAGIVAALQPRPSTSWVPAFPRGSARPPPSVPLPPRTPLFLGRGLLNRLMHALNGNINGWWGLAAAASAPIALQLHRGAVHVVEDSMHAVATISADVVEEIGHGARRTVWVAGTAITLVVVILCGAVLWYVSRAVANRIAHLRHGNTAAPVARLSQLLGSEATFEVASTKKGVTHKVWVHLKEETAACGCRAYLAEGRCGHCDAAMDTARSLGFLHTAQRGAGPALTDSIRSTASDALAKGKVVLGLGNSEGCFSQLAAKSRGLSCFQGLAGRDLAAAPADGASAAHAQSGSVQRATTATVARTPSRRNKGPVPARSSPVKEVEFLAGGPYVQAAQTLLGSGAAEDVVYIRAYSLDCPSCIEAIEASLSKGAGVRIVADMGQCHRTKLQWQALKRLAAAGAEVKVGCGTSVRDAYARDGRGAKVGTGIQGLHHAKALCLLRPDGAVVLIGSLNFTTSSKANAEAGLRLEVPKTHPVAQSYIEDFLRVSAEAFSLDEAVAKRPQLERASSSNVAGNATRAPNTAPQGIE